MEKVTNSFITSIDKCYNSNFNFIKLNLKLFRFKNLLAICFLLFLNNYSYSQNQGDTSIVAQIELINNTSDKKVLEGFAYNDGNLEVRLSATEKLFNLQKLKINKIKNQSFLADIAINSRIIDLYVAAVNKIKDNELLFKITQSNNKGAAVFALYKFGEYPNYIQLDTSKYYNQIVDLTNSNGTLIDESHQALATVGSLKLLEYDNITKKYHKNLFVSSYVNLNHRTYSGIDTSLSFVYKDYYWLNWSILIKSDEINRGYKYDNVKLLPQWIERSELNVMHYSLPKMDKICTDLLKSVSVEDLKRIVDASDIYYLREVARELLKELESDNAPIRPSQNIAETVFENLTKATSGCSFAYKFIKGDSDYYTRLKIMIGTWALGSFSISPGKAVQFVLENGEEVTLFNSKKITTETGAGATGLLGSEAQGMDLFLKIENDDMERLSKLKIIKLRIYTSKELIEKDINEGQNQTFQEMVINIMNK